MVEGQAPSDTAVALAASRASARLATHLHKHSNKRVSLQPIKLTRQEDGRLTGRVLQSTSADGSFGAPPLPLSDETIEALRSVENGQLIDRVEPYFAERGRGQAKHWALVLRADVWSAMVEEEDNEILDAARGERRQRLAHQSCPQARQRIEKLMELVDRAVDQMADLGKSAVLIQANQMPPVAMSLGE